MLWYGTLIICSIKTTVCDIDHAVYVGQSDPMYQTKQECIDAALRITLYDGTEFPYLEAGKQYQFIIECERDSAPA